MTTVSLFNASLYDIVVFINPSQDPPTDSDSKFFAPGASETTNWVPQQPQETLVWSNQQAQLPGQLGPHGAHIVIDYASKDGNPNNRRAKFKIPVFATAQTTLFGGPQNPALAAGVNVNSMQIYVFSTGDCGFHAILLNDGVATGVTHDVTQIPVMPEN